jgi:hypothetical protein
MSKQENEPSFPQFVITRIVEERVGFGLTFLGVIFFSLVGMAGMHERSPLVAFLKTFLGD